MKKLQSKKLCSLACAAVLVFSGFVPAVRAETAAEPEIPSVQDAKMHFRPIIRTHGVEFRWFRYPKPKEFVRYEIVRSGSKPAGTIIKDGVVAGETENRYSTNFDELLDAGTYHYQLCSVTKTKRICSKPTAITIKNKLPDNLKPPVPEAADPAVGYKIAPAGELELVITNDGVGNAVLAWTPLADADAGFKWYKPVRSQTEADPHYPRDGYLAHLKGANMTGFVDVRIPVGTSYYRICAVDGQDGLWCGNVVAVSR